jgi:hypothetical protein
MGRSVGFRWFSFRQPLAEERHIHTRQHTPHSAVSQARIQLGTKARQNLIL